MAIEEEVVGDIDGDESDYADQEYEIDRFCKAKPIDELLIGGLVLEDEFFILPGDVLGETGDFAVLDQHLLHLLLVDLLDHLDDVVHQSECGDAGGVIVRTVGLLERLRVLDLAELREVGLVLAEVAEIFEGSEGGLDLELEVHRDHAVFSPVFALQFVESYVLKSHKVEVRSLFVEQPKLTAGVV